MTVSPYIAFVLLNELQGSIPKVLDCGCGSGNYIALLEEHGVEAYGIDISEQAAKTSKQILGSATVLPVKNESLDAAISIHMIEHLPPKDVSKFLGEARRVLKHQGLLFLATPNTYSLMRIVLRRKWYGHRDSTHINLFNPIKLRKEVEKNGFDKIRTTFKLPILLVEKSSDKWTLPYYGLHRLFHICHWMQDLFMYLMVSTPLANIRDTTWLVAQKC